MKPPAPKAPPNNWQKNQDVELDLGPGFKPAPGPAPEEKAPLSKEDKLRSIAAEVSRIGGLTYTPNVTNSLEHSKRLQELANELKAIADE